MLNLSIIGDQCTGKILPLRYVKSEKKHVQWILYITKGQETCKIYIRYNEVSLYTGSFLIHIFYYYTAGAR